MSNNSLIPKLCEVMEAVGYIQKTGFNQQQRYKYAQESDVVEKVRKELAQRKVFLMNSVEDTSFRTIRTAKGNELTVATLTVKYTLIDGETGEKLEFTGVGEGMDSGDKAVYKAQTGALKYALMKTFLIPTGDDPERDHEEEGPKQPARQPRPRQNKPNQPTPSHNQTNGMASDAQRKKIFAMAKEKDVGNDNLKKLVKYYTGHDSTKDLTKEDASDLIKLLGESSGSEIIQMVSQKALEEAVQ